LGYEDWTHEKGYGRRWAVETAFSTFKRLFEEHSRQKHGIHPGDGGQWVQVQYAGEHVKGKKEKTETQGKETRESSKLFH
jgi:hypothetical protein